MRPLIAGLAVLLIPTFSEGQDSSSVAPKWAFDLFLGGSGSKPITARTGPKTIGTFDLAGWSHLGAGVDRCMAGRWSARLLLGYEIGGWDATGPGNPFAAPSIFGDRWVIGAGLVHQLFRGERSQINVFGGARLMMGMDVPAVIEVDTVAPGRTSSVTMDYRSSVGPLLNVGWRWRVKNGAAGAMGIMLGMAYFHATYQDVRLPAELAALPADLLPFTGTHRTWHYVLTIGYSGWR